MYLEGAHIVVKNEVEKGLSQKQVAETFALALWAENAGGIACDWKSLNDAVMARWGIKGLSRVKTMGWKIYEARVAEIKKRLVN